MRWHDSDTRNSQKLPHHPMGTAKKFKTLQNPIFIARCLLKEGLGGSIFDSSVVCFSVDAQSCKFPCGGQLVMRDEGCSCFPCCSSSCPRSNKFSFFLQQVLVLLPPGLVHLSSCVRFFFSCSHRECVHPVGENREAGQQKPGSVISLSLFFWGRGEGDISSSMHRRQIFFKCKSIMICFVVGGVHR